MLLQRFYQARKGQAQRFLLVQAQARRAVAGDRPIGNGQFSFFVADQPGVVDQVLQPLAVDGQRQALARQQDRPAAPLIRATLSITRPTISAALIKR
ncbi:MAG: hypothetical protein MZW92_37520 [Comamonadaceae bacterium]|nr:hypothetical protein [Comamonadaceae bacterium]